MWSSGTRVKTPGLRAGLCSAWASPPSPAVDRPPRPVLVGRPLWASGRPGLLPVGSALHLPLAPPLSWPCCCQAQGWLTALLLRPSLGNTTPASQPEQSPGCRSAYGGKLLQQTGSLPPPVSRAQATKCPLHTRPRRKELPAVSLLLRGQCQGHHCACVHSRSTRGKHGPATASPALPLLPTCGSGPPARPHSCSRLRSTERPLPMPCRGLHSTHRLTSCVWTRQRAARHLLRTA